MEMRLVNGRYVPDAWGGFETVRGDAEVLERVLFKLASRRGGFALLPELGSRLYLLSREKPSSRLGAARQFITEALSSESGVTLSEISLEELDAGKLKITVGFDYLGTGQSVSLEL